MSRLSDDGSCYVHPIQNEFDWMVWDNVLKQDGYILEINTHANRPCWFAGRGSGSGSGWVHSDRTFVKEWTCWEDAARHEWYVRAIKPAALLDITGGN